MSQAEKHSSTAPVVATSRTHVDAHMRQRLEAAVERLLAILDALDGDPDLEPSLGWTKTHAYGSDLDLEDEHDGVEPDEDFEDADDDGIADADGLAEQFGSARYTLGVV